MLNLKINKPIYPQFNKFIISVLIGTLLGDSSLQTYTNGNTWRARFLQGDIHKDYLFHLYDIFKLYVKTPPKLSDDGFGNKRWSFNTCVIPELKTYADLFYKKVGNKRIKVINPKIYDYFDEISMAYWLMDDGNLKQVDKTKSLILCTDSYSKEEVLLLGNMLETKYNIHVSYHLKGGNYRIYIPTRYYLEIKNKIEPIIHESMKYKLG